MRIIENNAPRAIITCPHCKSKLEVSEHEVALFPGDENRNRRVGRVTCLCCNKEICILYMRNLFTATANGYK